LQIKSDPESNLLVFVPTKQNSRIFQWEDTVAIICSSLKEQQAKEGHVHEYDLAIDYAVSSNKFEFMNEIIELVTLW
jgi:hypothetical protein